MGDQEKLLLPSGTSFRANAGAILMCEKAVMDVGVQSHEGSDKIIIP